MWKETITSQGLTSAQQQVSVGERLAVACLSLGILAVTSQKMTVELSFQRVWRDWRPASTFSAVHISPARNDLLTILRKSQSRRRTVVAALECDKSLRPYLVDDGWTVDHAADVLHKSCGIPIQSWV
jgi:hypothetical protein